MDITAQQAVILERLIGQSFQIVAFAMYESYIGVRKGNCGALLAPQVSGGLSIYGEPAYLVGGTFGVKMFRSDGPYFVSKKKEIAATPERICELAEFAAELSNALLPTA
jgi:hypothetical protein